MNTDLKMTKTEIKNHLIEKFGDEIKNQTFDIVRYTSFEELDKVEDDLYYYLNPKYNLRKGIDDGDPYFSLNNIDLNQMIEIITMDFSFGFFIETKNDTEDKYDLLTETLTELI
jgi:non-homologous end joining protein Ku